MTADIHEFDGPTRNPIPCDKVLEGAKGKLSAVLVLGFDEWGQLYMAANTADKYATLWLLEQSKLELMAL